MDIIKKVSKITDIFSIYPKSALHIWALVAIVKTEHFLNIFSIVHAFPAENLHTTPLSKVIVAQTGVPLHNTSQFNYFINFQCTTLIRLAKSGQYCRSINKQQQ
ncbi:unnamed protein product [Ceratitis capitata]|uniref:(Mediterranean fruit fly) hypothetical protein n=1 Tax=Ceratitis capitata TaxID=7213 RepID=A0A811UJC6_CERCA|nr:unnamed protein product [Ceratitis capitata]